MVESYTQATQKIVDRYIEAGQPWPATVKQIAAWAIESKLWVPPPSRYALCGSLRTGDE